MEGKESLRCFCVIPCRHCCEAWSQLAFIRDQRTACAQALVQLHALPALGSGASRSRFSHKQAACRLTQAITGWPRAALCSVLEQAPALDLC